VGIRKERRIRTGAGGGYGGWRRKGRGSSGRRLEIGGGRRGRHGRARKRAGGARVGARARRGAGGKGGTRSGEVEGEIRGRLLILARGRQTRSPRAQDIPERPRRKSPSGTTSRVFTFFFFFFLCFFGRMGREAPEALSRKGNKKGRRGFADQPGARVGVHGLRAGVRRGQVRLKTPAPQAEDDGGGRSRAFHGKREGKDRPSPQLLANPRGSVAECSRPPRPSAPMSVQGNLARVRDGAWTPPSPAGGQSSPLRSVPQDLKGDFRAEDRDLEARGRGLQPPRGRRRRGTTRLLPTAPREPGKFPGNWGKRRLRTARPKPSLNCSRQGARRPAAGGRRRAQGKARPKKEKTNFGQYRRGRGLADPPRIGRPARVH